MERHTHTPGQSRLANKKNLFSLLHFFAAGLITKNCQKRGGSKQVFLFSLANTSRDTQRMAIQLCQLLGTQDPDFRILSQTGFLDEMGFLHIVVIKPFIPAMQVTTFRSWPTCLPGSQSLFNLPPA